MKRQQTSPALPPSPLATVHRLFRGRYAVAVVVASMFAAALAPVGYKHADPKFSSTGMLRVSPVVPKILYGNEDNGQLPQFDSYLVAQMQLVSSRPVLELAVADPEMRKIDWPEGPAGVAELGRRLGIVKGGPRSELIEISVSHGHPLAATQAVNSVLAAVVSRSVERHEQTSSLRETTLQSRLDHLQNELKTAEQNLLSLAAEYGPDNLGRVHTAKVVDIERLDGKIDDLDNNIAEQLAKRNSEVASEESDDEVKRLTIADHAMANLLLRRADKSVELNNAARVYGKVHYRYLSAKANLDVVERSIQDRIEQLATLGKTGVLTAQNAVAGDENTINQLRELRGNMVVMRAKAADVSMALGQRRFEVALLQSRRTELLGSIEDTRRRLDQVRVESGASLPGRVSVAVRGMVPVAPIEDKRRMTAMGAGLIGLLVGLVLSVADRLACPRVLLADDLNVASAEIPLLGAIPDVVAGAAGDAASARRQISLLRSALETRVVRLSGSAPVILITSASSGEGKTNIALALARGCAASGQRTLLIDGDLQHRGLTRLLCLGSKPGLLDLLRAGRSESWDFLCDRPDLSVVPAGDTDDLFGETLSQHQLSSALEHLRSRFDVIIVDADVCPSSATTQLFASLAQHVVLVVRRGQKLAAVGLTVERLSKVTAAPVGFVLNRATTADLPANSQLETPTAAPTGFALELQPA